MSSASPPRATICSIASSALGIVAFECEHALAVVVGDAERLTLLEVDVDEGLVGGDHERVVGHLVGGEFEGDARPADPRDACEDLDLVVEAGGCEVLDV